MKFLSLLLLLSFAASAMPEASFNQLRNAIINKAHLDFPQAIQDMDSLLKKQASSLTLEQKIRLLYHKAIFQQRSNRINDALQTLADCQTLSLQSNDRSILYSYHNILGGIYQNHGMYQQALAHYQQALPLAKLLPTVEFYYQAGNNLGLVLLSLGQYDEAVSYFRQFLRFGEQQQRDSIIAVGWTNLADVAFKRQNLAEAERLHQQALLLRLQKNMESSWSWCGLTSVAIARREWHRAAILNGECLRLRQGRAEQEKIDAAIMQANILQHMEAGPAAQQLLEAQLPLSQRAQLLPQQAQLWHQLSELYQRRHKPAQALVAIQQYQQVNEQIMARRFNLTVAQASANLALSRREHEIEQLEQQRQHQLQASLAERQFWLVLSVIGSLLISGAIWFSWQIRRKNQALAHSLQQLEQTRHQLVETAKQAALTQLVCGMAHQLNTPLGTIMTATSCADEQLRSIAGSFAQKTLSGSALQEHLDSQQQLLALINTSSQRAATMVERFKLLSASQQRSALQSIALASFCRCYLQDLASLHGLQSQQVQCSGADPTLALDPQLLQLILQLLTENSVMHCQQPLELLRLTVEIEAQPTAVSLHFSDNGPALAPEISQRIFEPFFTTRSGHRHLGLGLTIAFNAAQQMQGYLAYNPAAGHCSFVLTLPVQS